MQPPEWVHVWFWLRFMRDPRDLTPLPQQDERNPDAMEWADYEVAHENWRAAGSPMTTTKTLITVMAGEIEDEDDGIPF